MQTLIRQAELNYAAMMRLKTVRLAAQRRKKTGRNPETEARNPEPMIEGGRVTPGFRI
jgi:hypothetical protein